MSGNFWPIKLNEKVKGNTEFKEDHTKKLFKFYSFIQKSVYDRKELLEMCSKLATEAL